MKKPVVFISHSSKDQRMVRKLKELLAKKLDGTLDIFVSSDGQSIPFGRNWVHEIEEALKSSELVFVLLSPNSVRSSWIYFEAGFSYSKGIEVIPIGVLGIDLSQLPPPMSLLQGFNINSVESLNNLISVINRKFEHSHQETFNEKEYAEIFGLSKVKHNDIFKEYLPLINEISAEVPINVTSAFGTVGDYLASKKVEYQSSEKMLDTFGISIQETQSNLWLVQLDPDLTDVTFPLLNDIIRLIMGSSFEFYAFSIDFSPMVNCIEEKYKVSSRMYGTEIKILDNYYFDYQNIAFHIGRRYYWTGFTATVSTATGLYSAPTQSEIGNVFMEVKYNGQNLVGIPIHTLLSRLFELGILLQS
ncbi:toll/interleukin-1 receptor domain-containing protein [Chloroflexota bacterium]